MTTSRERVLAAIAHKEADRVPIDLGSMPSTGIMAIGYHRLKEYLGIQNGPVRIYDIGQQLAEPEKLILERFHIDVLDARRSLTPALETSEGWQPFELVDYLATPPETIPAEASSNFLYKSDGEGGIFLCEKDGKKIAHKPKNSLYFTGWEHPLAEAETVDDLKRLWPRKAPTQEELQLIRDKSKYLHENTDQAIMLGFGGSMFENGQGLRGWEQFMIDLGLGGPLTETLLEMMCEQWLVNLQAVLDACGQFIDIIQVGDDLGTQDACQISPATYKKMIYPYHKKVYQAIHDHPTHPHIFLHSCGSIEPLIGDLIDAGIEILNPVQTSAKGMDPVNLKKKYGNDLTFWGGGCETQSTLPNGSPDEVAEEVKKRIDIFAPGGGFVFNQIHNIQANIPPQNVEAMFETAFAYGKY